MSRAPSLPHLRRPRCCRLAPAAHGAPRGGTHLEIQRARLGAELLQVLQVGFAQGIPQQGAARIAGRGLLAEGLVAGDLVGTERPSPGGCLGISSCTEGERMGSGPPGEQGDALGPARSEEK